MRNIARLSDEERYELFRNTANKMKLHDAIVEKDFWVCFTLDYFFHRSPWKKAITFKGHLFQYNSVHCVFFNFTFVLFVFAVLIVIYTN